MSIITVSRQMGAGAERIIAGVAEVLDLGIIDRAVIGRSAIAAGVPKVVFQELTFEGQRSLVQRMLEIMHSLPSIPVAPQVEQGEAIGPLTLPFGGVFASAAPPATGTRATMQRYVEVVSMVIRDLAGQGSVLIVGMGSQAILRDDPGALHLKIIAAFEDRVQRLMERDRIHRGEALRRLQASDQARANYVRKYYGLDWLDPQHYHLVVNTSKTGVQGAIDAVVAGARAVERSRTG